MVQTLKTVIVLWHSDISVPFLHVVIFRVVHAFPIEYQFNHLLPVASPKTLNVDLGRGDSDLRVELVFSPRRPFSVTFSRNGTQNTELALLF